MTRTRAVAGAVTVALLVACSRIVDIRPWVAHKNQRLEDGDTLVTLQHGIRASVRYMRDAELDDMFRLPGGVIRETGNPFICRPPHAPARFTVFRVTVHNESEYDTFVEPDKILLRTNRSTEHHPLTRQQLIDYWIGRVTVELGKPLTWTPQMDAVRRLEVKEKSLRATIYEGGRLPSRGEHTGYLAFRDLPVTLKTMQLMVEVVTRSSRYGNPLDVALMAFNFGRIKVPVPPKDVDDQSEWIGE